ncbi:MAG: hypothetical protein H6747_13365 [Deltaproteobacteria bacterium]|nr:hypothetical protein [Deltaproteobacteria bacterium]
MRRQRGNPTRPLALLAWAVALLLSGGCGSDTLVAGPDIVLDPDTAADIGSLDADAAADAAADADTAAAADAAADADPAADADAAPETDAAADAAADAKADATDGIAPDTVQPDPCAGLNCDDGDPCSDDGCSFGSCTHVPSSGAVCDDGDACTNADLCLAGACVGAPLNAAACDDGNPCTTDSCAAAAGCVHLPAESTCTDGDPCTAPDLCVAGSCLAGSSSCACKVDADCAGLGPEGPCVGKRVCDKSGAAWVCKLETSAVPNCATESGGPCKVGICDANLGGCSLAPVPNGKPCDADGTACTVGDACAEGTCTAGPALPCDDGNPCTADACEAGTGCVHLAAPATCDADGDPCTGPDSCVGKVCVAGAAQACDDGNPCTVDGCDKATGACVHDGAAASGLPCDADGTACTPGDACKAGSCEAGTPLNCDDDNVCTADLCESGVGCVHLAAPATCDADSDACTGPDSCVGKACVAGPKKSCDDGDACTADACDSAEGACAHLPIPGCGGLCELDAHCDDGKACTTDSCKDGSCSHSDETGTACDDGDVCTTADGCAAGACVGAPLPCADANPCTFDGCVAGKGCVHLAQAGPCDDGDACTALDACNEGVCTAGAPKDCSDGDACTEDACVKGDGACVHSGIPGCGGYCAKVGDCADGDPCTTDACAAGKCTYSAAPGPCEDGNACTLGDSCSGGVCVAGKAKVCDDSDPCTVDGCDGKSGACTLAPAATGTTCDDADACTGPDACAFFAGPGSKVVCKGVPQGSVGNTACDDGNACTYDACNQSAGSCIHVATPGVACDDGAPCTVGELCDGDVCKAVAAIHVRSLAGDGKASFADGTPGQLNGPYGVALNAAGVTYVGDTSNNRIRRIDASGAITTLAGAGKAGLLDGAGDAAWFNAPMGLGLRKDGSLLVADRENHALRRVGGDGAVVTLSGDGVAGFADGPGNTARWNRPYDVAIGPLNTVFWVADTYNHRVRRVDLGAGQVASTATVSTLAGGAAGYKDGVGAAARFNYPVGVARDGAGRLYVADQHNHRIRRILPDGTVQTVAGSGNAGFLDGNAATARFYYPYGVAVDARGVLWIADRYNHRVRSLDGGVVETFVGSSAGFVDGTSATARLHYPAGIAVDPFGRIAVADSNNHRVRLIVDARTPCQAESGCYASGFPGVDAPCARCLPAKTQAALSAQIDGSSCDDASACTSGDSCTGGVCGGTDLAGGNGSTCDDKDGCTIDSCDGASGACVHSPIVGCGGNCKVASDCDDGNPCTDQACTGGKCALSPNAQPCDDGQSCTYGDVCSGGSCKPGDRTEVATLCGSSAGLLDGPAATARFNGIRALAVLPAGSDPSGALLWVLDGNNHLVRAVQKDGSVSTRAGSSAGFADGVGAAAKMSTPSDLDVDALGRGYIADTNNHRIRMLLPNGTLSTLAGGTQGLLDGKGTAARFRQPVGVATRGKGEVVYVAEYGNHTIRRIDADGTVTTLAGGTFGDADGFGAAARFRYPYDVEVAPDGSLLVADLGNARIRRISADGAVTTLAGNGTAGYVNGPLASARFNQPWKVHVAASGVIYVADRYNNRIRTIRGNLVGTLAGTGSAGLVDGDGLSTARLREPLALDTDQNGLVYFADYIYHRVRTVRDSSGVCSIGGACVAAGIRAVDAPCKVCDAAVDAKAWSPVADGLGCEDGAPCSLGDTCSEGSCKGKPRDCDDGNACSADSCDAAGACAWAPVAGCDGWCFTDADCADGDACTADTCKGASGAAGAPGAKFGTCGHAKLTSSPSTPAPCDDGDACTVGDACQAGVCTAGQAVEVSTLAGSSAGLLDGVAGVARFNQPYGLAIDVTGTTWVADQANHRIRRIEAGGNTSTLCGQGAGLVDGPFAVARFNAPAGVALGAAQALVVSEVGNHRIRLVDHEQQIVSTLAGSVAGYLDGKGTAARFSSPWGLDALPSGVVYVADYGNHRIRRVATDGTVTTVCGGTAGFLEGLGTAARLHGPIDVAVRPDGALVVAEYTGHRIRSVSAEGQTQLLAGSAAGAAGMVDDKAGAARFAYPRGVGVDPLGRVLVADQNNHRIRIIAAGGATTTLAGNGVAGLVEGEATQARFNSPRGIAVGVDGRVVVSDTGNARLRSVWRSAASCNVDGRCWIAGAASPGAPCSVCARDVSAKGLSPASDGTACDDGAPCTAPGTCGSGSCAQVAKSCDDGDACTTDACDAATGACQHTPIIGCNGYCELDAHCDDGNPCTLGARCEKKSCIQGDAVVVTTRAGAVAGYQDGTGIGARLLAPQGLAPLRDASGKDLGVVVVDTGNRRLRLLAADGSVTTLAGSGSAGLVDGTGTAAWLHTPWGATALAGGGVAFADAGSHTIRSVDAAGKVTTIAGSGVAGYQDDATPDARFNQPADVAAGPAGVLYVSDRGNHRIRRILPEGLVVTLAGIGAGFADGDAAKARFSYPSGVDVDADGRIYVADTGNHRIRRVDGEGNVITVAGKGTNGWLDGEAAKALLSSPFDVAVDAAGRVWFSDRGNHRIRRLAGGVVTTVTGNVAGFLDAGAASRFSSPAGIWVHPGGVLHVADQNNHRIRQVHDGGPSCAIDGACWADGAENPAKPCQRCSAASKADAFVTKADGAACVDGNPCSTASTCQAGSCKATEQVACNDNNPCSVDACESKTGACVYTPIPGCSP